VRAAALASIALVIIFVGETVIRKFLAKLDKPRAKVEE